MDSLNFEAASYQSDNQDINNMEILDSKTAYKAPRVKVVEVNAQGVLCQSGGINSMSIDEDGGDDFE